MSRKKFTFVYFYKAAKVFRRNTGIQRYNGILQMARFRLTRGSSGINLISNCRVRLKIMPNRIWLGISTYRIFKDSKIPIMALMAFIILD